MIIYDNNDNYHMLIIMIIMNNYNRIILLIGIMILRSVSQPTRQRALLTLLAARRLASTARLHPLARPYGRGWGGSAAATRSPTRSATTGTCGSKAAILGMWPFSQRPNDTRYVQCGPSATRGTRCRFCPLHTRYGQCGLL